MAGPRSARILPAGTEPAAGLMMDGSRAMAHLGPTMNSAVCSKSDSSQRRARRDSWEGNATHLVELGSHVEVEDLGLAGDLDRDERVDLKVRKVEVDVDAVQAREEVDERVLALLARDAGEQLLLDLVAARELAADGHEKGERLGVDVADVDSTLVGEEEHVAVADRVDADVELGVRRVREERLDDEVRERALGRLDLQSRSWSVAGKVGEAGSKAHHDLLAGALKDPCLALGPSLVQETVCASNVRWIATGRRAR